MLYILDILFNVYNLKNFWELLLIFNRHVSSNFVSTFIYWYIAEKAICSVFLWINFYSIYYLLGSAYSPTYTAYSYCQAYVRNYSSKDQGTLMTYLGWEDVGLELRIFRTKILIKESYRRNLEVDVKGYWITFGYRNCGCRATTGRSAYYLGWFWINASRNKRWEWVIEFRETQGL